MPQQSTSQQPPNRQPPSESPGPGGPPPTDAPRAGGPSWRVQILKPLALVAASVLVCSGVFSMDHEIRSVRDLFGPGVWPAYLLYGLPLWILMLIQAYLLEIRLRAAFVTLVVASGLALGGIVWVAGSQAQTAFGQARNLVILATLASLAIGGPVALIHAAVEALDPSGAGRGSLDPGGGSPGPSSLGAA